jgi:hypothetical protein
MLAIGKRIRDDQSGRLESSNAHGRFADPIWRSSEVFASMCPVLMTVDRADAEAPASQHCSNSGRKRLARMPTCLFCGNRLPLLPDNDQRVIASPKMLGRQNEGGMKIDQNTSKEELRDL